MPVTRNLVFNIDVNEIWIHSNAKTSGSKASKVEPNPLAIGLGFGWRL